LVRVPFPIPFFRQQPLTEPPAMVRVVSREDVQWNRPLFKAPPLNVQPPLNGANPFVTNLRKSAAISGKVIR
jgi:hypothetical protein